MILEALRVLLFGMLGIFIVMAIIFGVIVLLSRISRRFTRDAESLTDADEGSGAVVAVADVVDEPGEVETYVVYEDGEYEDGEYLEPGVEYVYETEYVDENGYDQVEVARA